MSRISAFLQNIFASAVEVGQFGSLANGDPTLTTDPEVAQSLTAYGQGWAAAVVGDNDPTIEETNGLLYSITSMLAYIQQEGVCEYIPTKTYYANPTPSIVKKPGTTQLYKSLTDGNIGNPLTNVVNWALLGDLANLAGGSSSIVQNGYTTLPSGLILQWGYAVGVNPPCDITLPTTFPNYHFACFVICDTYNYNSGSGGTALCAAAPNSSTPLSKIHITTNFTGNAYFIAVGN